MPLTAEPRGDTVSDMRCGASPKTDALYRMAARLQDTLDDSSASCEIAHTIFAFLFLSGTEGTSVTANPNV